LAARASWNTGDPNNGFTSEIFTLFDHIQPNISSQII
jgi:hypothetical protein